MDIGHDMVSRRLKLLHAQVVSTCKRKWFGINVTIVHFLLLHASLIPSAFTTLMVDSHSQEITWRVADLASAP